jgi:hypothetical protein
MRQVTFFICVFILLTGCHKGKKVDFIIHNALIHTANEKNETFEAIAISDGKIVDIGVERYILNKYRAHEYLDAEQKSIYPGFHCSFSQILKKSNEHKGIDLSKCTSVVQVSNILLREKQLNNMSKLLGENVPFSIIDPQGLLLSNMMDSLFSNEKVMLVGEGKILVKRASFEEKIGLTNFNSHLIQEYFGTVNTKNRASYILEAQENCFQFGITSCDEHAITIEDLEDLELIKKLIRSKLLKLELNLFLNANETSSMFAKSVGISNYKNYWLQGFSDVNTMQQILQLDLAQTNYQVTLDALNFKRIDQIDSLNALLNTLYTRNPDHGWRIKNAQELTSNTRKALLANGAYLLFTTTAKTTEMVEIAKKEGMFSVVLADDDNIWDPFTTYSQLIENGLDQNSALKSVTSWPSYMAKSNNRTGSLEKGKWANLIITQLPLGTASNDNYPIYTFIRGKKVFTIK